MRFALRLAYREARSSWARLLFFFLSLSVGVGAMVFVRSLIESVRGALGREARALTAADVVVAGNRPWSEAQRATLERLLSRPGLQARCEVVSTNTMASVLDDQGAPRLVELRGVEAAFPFYGQVELQGRQAYSHALLRERGVLASPELLAQLGLRVGDALLLGGQRFTLRGVVLKEPGRRPSVFSLGPRLLVDLHDLRAAGLLGFGSRASHQVLLQVRDDAQPALLRELREAFAQEAVSVRSFRTTESQLGDGLQQAEGYLSLTAFAMLVLGGIGVSSVVRVFVHQKLRSIAILKCLGARQAQVAGAYLLQVLGLALLGGLLGLGLSRALLLLVPPESLAGLGAPELRLAPLAAAQSVGVGMLVALLFALAPLMDVRRVKPLLVLREESVPGGRRDWPKLLMTGLAAAALLALGAWQAGSPRAGGQGCGALLVLGAALLLLARLLVRAAAALGRGARFPLRQALLRLSRPGNQTRPVLLALGLGCCLVLSVASLRGALLQQLGAARGADAADLFLMDVQPDQAEPLVAFLREHGAGPSRLVPVLRARLVGVAGRELRLETAEDVRARGSLGREYVVTQRAALEANERLSAGRFWDTPTTGAAEVSIERSLERRYGLHLGDELRFDILGRRVSARVTSVREVAWSDTRSAGGFMFVFRPGSLRGAPETRLGFVRAPAGEGPRAALQRDLARAFPNVSSVDLRDVLATLERLVGRLSLAISLVGAVSLLLGVLILVGAVAVSRYERRRESAVLRTLGARPASVAALLALEQAALGAVAGLAGGLGALATSAALCRFLLEIPFTPPWTLLALGPSGAAAGAALVGVLASLDVLRGKPLAVLRAG